MDNTPLIPTRRSTPPTVEEAGGDDLDALKQLGMEIQHLCYEQQHADELKEKAYWEEYDLVFSAHEKPQIATGAIRSETSPRLATPRRHSLTELALSAEGARRIWLNVREEEEVAAAERNQEILMETGGC